MEKEIHILDTENDGYFNNKEGRWVEYDINDLPTLKPFDGSVQPISKELAFKDYRFTKDCKYIIFCDLVDEIQLGTKLKIDDKRHVNKIYVVVWVDEWSNHMEVLIDDE